MARTCLNGSLLLSVILALASAASAQDDRDRDRDRNRNASGREETDRDRDRERNASGREETGRDRDRDRDRDEGPGRGSRMETPDAPSRPTFRRERNRDDDEGTEEGMPSARMAPPGTSDPRFAPPGWRPQWKLGVFAANTDTGVRITRVVPGSPAFRAGIERGDRIVNINGYQIGYVNGRLYSLGEELQRRAGRDGRVALLLHNWRNKELLYAEVQLERQR